MAKSNCMSALAVIATLTSVAHAHAAPMFTAFGGIAHVDYAVPTDGQTYEWQLRPDDAHLGATIILGSPNEVFARLAYGAGGGAISYVQGDMPFSWQQDAQPGLTVIRVRAAAAANYSNCGPVTPVSLLCGERHVVWGDGVLAQVYEDGILSAGEVVVSRTIAAAPEPATWATLIVGLLSLGVVLRSSRRARVATLAA